jgi:hypothetical protein
MTTLPQVDIVVPLIGEDLDRFIELQRPTFEQHYRDLSRTMIVTTPREMERVRRRTRGLPQVEVVDERELIPELAWSRLLGRDTMRGWYLQQLVKLAAVAEASSPFVLVLDGDVIAVREFSDAELVVDGRALRPREQTRDETWIRQAGMALGVQPLDYMASVTPSVLSRSAVHDLAAHASTSVRPHREIARLAMQTPLIRRKLGSWRGRLLAALPWTEYQLYDTFLVRAGLFDRYHWYGADHQRIYGNCVWDREGFEGWVPGPQERISFMLSIVTSRASIPAERVRSRLVETGTML